VGDCYVAGAGKSVIFTLGGHMTIAERCAKIIRLAELAQAAEDERGYRQYMEQIHIISFVG
jgi:hypothetical protein